MLLICGFEKPNRHLHFSHDAPCLPPTPQILHNLYFSFLLGITAVPREIKNNAYAELWGAKVLEVKYFLFHPSKRERETAFFTPGFN